MVFYLDDNNNIVFIKPIQKGRNMVKIYFSRDVDEREMYDYPLAFADSEKNQRIFPWIKGFTIIEVMVKKKSWFGLKNYWIKAEKL